jgi:D-3-phosphoglycerate dehydrogenase
VDEEVLANALRDGAIAAAGLAVFAVELLSADSQLRELDNVTLTDHAGWYSEESLAELKKKAAENVACGRQAAVSR